MTRGPAFLPVIDNEGQGRKRRHLTLIINTSQQTRGRASSPSFTCLGLTHVQHSHAWPTPLQGTEPGLLFQILQQVRRRANFPALMSSVPALLPSISDVKVGLGACVTCPCLWGQFSHDHTLRASSLMSLPSGSALPCCPSEVQACFPTCYSK